MEYSIGDVAKRTGLTPHTLRYYEKEGLLLDISRKSNGLRVFGDDDIEWLGIISCLKDTGMSIANIKQYMALCKDGRDSIETRKELFKTQRQHIKNQIARLNQHLETAQYKIWYYENIERLGDESDPLNCEKMRKIYEKIGQGDVI